MNEYFNFWVFVFQTLLLCSWTPLGFLKLKAVICRLYATCYICGLVSIVDSYYYYFYFIDMDLAV